MRCARTRVLPLPAPARTRRGPSPWVTASFCGGLSGSRMRRIWLCRPGTAKESWSLLVKEAPGKEDEGGNLPKLYRAEGGIRVESRPDKVLSYSHACNVRSYVCV